MTASSIQTANPVHPPSGQFVPYDDPWPNMMKQQPQWGLFVPQARSPQQVFTPSKEAAPEDTDKDGTSKDPAKLGLLGFVFPLLTILGAPLMLVAILMGLRTRSLKLNPIKSLISQNSTLFLGHEGLFAQAFKGLPRKVSKKNYQQFARAIEAHLKTLPHTEANQPIRDAFRAYQNKPDHKALKKFLNIPEVAQVGKSKALIFKQFAEGSHGEKTIKTIYNIGKGMLAIGVIPKVIIGLQYGVNSGQPSIVFSKVLELLLTPLLWFGSPIATAFNALVGAVFTMGFANDMEGRPFEDKDHTGPEKPKINPRYYDMSRFKSSFERNSGLSTHQRIGVFSSEMARMMRFSADDMWAAIARVTRNIGKAGSELSSILVRQFSYRNVRQATAQANPDKSPSLLAMNKQALSKTRLKNNVRDAKAKYPNELLSLDQDSGPPKSSFALMLTYLATIPSIINAFVPENINPLHDIVPNFSRAVQSVSACMSEFSLILFSTGGTNIFERLPAVSATLELLGTMIGYSNNPVMQGVAQAIQQFGAGTNSMFYAHRSQKKGLPGEQHHVYSGDTQTAQSPSETPEQKHVNVAA